MVASISATIAFTAIKYGACRNMIVFFNSYIIAF